MSVISAPKLEAIAVDDRDGDGVGDEEENVFCCETGAVVCGVTMLDCPFKFFEKF